MTPFTNDGSPLLLETVTTGACVLALERAAFRQAAFYVVFSDAAKGGKVVFEVAHNAGFLGQWHELATVPWFDGARVQYVPVFGPHLAVRIRVASPVIGGTVSVYGVAQ